MAQKQELPGGGPGDSGQGDSVRLADVLGAFSLASDLAVGLQAGHGARCCWMAAQIAQELELPASQRSDLYYAELLKDAGCTAWTSQLAAFWLADEITAKRDLQFLRDSQNPMDVTSWIVAYVAKGAPLPVRVDRGLDFLLHGKGFLREGFESTCQMAARIAQRMGMSQEVQTALTQVFEQWDGRGMPSGRKAGGISILSRIVFLTSHADAFRQLTGLEGAVRHVTEQRGRAFDPAVADAFLTIARKEDFWQDLDDGQLWERVLSLEPADAPNRYISQEALTDICIAMADYADMKVPFLAGHSRRVAGLSQEIAARLSFPKEQATALYRAGLLHDIGLVAVPSFVQAKPEAQRAPAEREQFRLHPYHSRSIAARVPALGDAAEIVAAHHERMDGRGFYRGLSGTSIPRSARILAVLDRYDQWTHHRPDSPAMESAQAIGLLRSEAGTQLSPEVVEALASVVDAPGQAVRRPRASTQPAGLTDREAEVLTLAARGLGRRDIGRKLFISEGTVRSHLEHIYGKIGVTNRASATLFAIEHGLLQ